MKNRHPKRKLAQKMLTPFEIKKHISPFNSKAWVLRNDARRKKLLDKSK